VTVRFVTSGSVEDYRDAPTTAAILAALAVAAGLPQPAASGQDAPPPLLEATLDVMAASISLTARFTVTTPEVAARAAAAASERLRTAADLTALLVAAGLRGITAESPPDIAARRLELSFMSTAAAAALALGALSGPLLFVACAWRRRRRLMRGRRGHPSRKSTTLNNPMVQLCSLGSSFTSPGGWGPRHDDARPLADPDARSAKLSGQGLGLISACSGCSSSVDAVMVHGDLGSPSESKEGENRDAPPLDALPVDGRGALPTYHNSVVPLAEDVFAAHHVGQGFATMAHV
jgi:hypothetical protein